MVVCKGWFSYGFRFVASVGYTPPSWQSRTVNDSAYNKQYLVHIIVFDQTSRWKWNRPVRHRPHRPQQQPVTRNINNTNLTSSNSSAVAAAIGARIRAATAPAAWTSRLTRPLRTQVRTMRRRRSRHISSSSIPHHHKTSVVSSIAASRTVTSVIIMGSFSLAYTPFNDHLLCLIEFFGFYIEKIFYKSLWHIMHIWMQSLKSNWITFESLMLTICSKFSHVKLYISELVVFNTEILRYYYLPLLFVCCCNLICDSKSEIYKLIFSIRRWYPENATTKILQLE